jgi:hypothetical protein
MGCNTERRGHREKYLARWRASARHADLRWRRALPRADDRSKQQRGRLPGEVTRAGGLPRTLPRHLCPRGDRRPQSSQQALLAAEDLLRACQETGPVTPAWAAGPRRPGCPRVPRRRAQRVVADRHHRADRLRRSPRCSPPLVAMAGRVHAELMHAQGVVGGRNTIALLMRRSSLAGLPLSRRAKHVPPAVTVRARARRPFYARAAPAASPARSPAARRVSRSCMPLRQTPTAPPPAGRARAPRRVPR